MVLAPSSFFILVAFFLVIFISFDSEKMESNLRAWYKGSYKEGISKYP